MTNTQFKPGQRVRATFEGEVTGYTGDNTLRLRVNDRDLSTFETLIPPHAIIEPILPEATPLEIGEQVNAFTCFNLKVLAVHKEAAWLLFPNGTTREFHIKDLSRPDSSSPPIMVNNG